jgi:hypothetical protein
MYVYVVIYTEQQQQHYIQSNRSIPFSAVMWGWKLVP